MEAYRTSEATERGTSLGLGSKGSEAFHRKGEMFGKQSSPVVQVSFSGKRGVSGNNFLPGSFPMQI